MSYRAIKKIETFIEMGISIHDYIISTNPGAIHILQKYSELIRIYILENPGIFEPTVRSGVSEIMDGHVTGFIIFLYKLGTQR
jgi:hypothetical protein